MVSQRRKIFTKKTTNFIYNTAEEALPGLGTVGFGDLFLKSQKSSSGQHVLQDTLANQLLAFPARQEVLWTEGTDVRMTTSCFLT